MSLPSDRNLSFPMWSSLIHQSYGEALVVFSLGSSRSTSVGDVGTSSCATSMTKNGAKSVRDSLVAKHLSLIVA